MLTVEHTVYTDSHDERVRGPIFVANIAFPDDTRERGCADLLESGEWTSLMLYRDAQGPAIHCVRSPSIGPIRPATSVIR